jgi:hypothetical protein
MTPCTCVERREEFGRSLNCRVVDDHSARTPRRLMRRHETTCGAGPTVVHHRGEYDTHAAVLTEGPAEVLTTVPDDVRRITELRNRGAAWTGQRPGCG